MERVNPTKGNTCKNNKKELTISKLSSNIHIEYILNHQKKDMCELCQHFEGWNKNFPFSLHEFTICSPFVNVLVSLQFHRLNPCYCFPALCIIIIHRNITAIILIITSVVLCSLHFPRTSGNTIYTLLYISMWITIYS